MSGNNHKPECGCFICSPTPIAERFWAKVDRNGPLHPVLLTQCWNWTGSKAHAGYGRINTRHGRIEVASRVSWEIHNGPIPDGLFVLHKCDNPPCTNPDHLFLGTHDDNAADMSAKGRWNNQGVNATHCPRGHEYTEENVYRRPNGTSRSCRKCRASTGALYKQGVRVRATGTGLTGRFPPIHVCKTMERTA